MPTICCAIGCSNRFDPEMKQRGISFHKVPSDPERREAWRRAMRRDFTITKYTVICSAHFEEKDLDRTGQTYRLRDGVTPSIFNFPDKRPDRDPDWENPGRRSTRTRKRTNKGEIYKSAIKPEIKKKTVVRKIYLPHEPFTNRGMVQKARKSIHGSKRLSVKEELSETALTSAAPATPTPAPAVLCADDHHYAIDPGCVKQKLDEAYARIDELQKELRNYKLRLRRKDEELQALTIGVEEQNTLMGQLLDNSELWVLCDRCQRKE